MKESEKLEKARELISQVIYENKHIWDKQYIWLSKLLHSQGALREAITELNEKELRIKKPLVGENGR
jgi:hypothetical protein